MKRNDTKAVLFTLQLKITDKIIDVEVLKDDDKKSLVERVCKLNQLPYNLQDQIQQKITNSLSKILKQDSVAPALLDKVLKFFQKSSFVQPQECVLRPVENAVKLTTTPVKKQIRIQPRQQRYVAVLRPEEFDLTNEPKTDKFDSSLFDTPDYEASYFNSKNLRLQAESELDFQYSRGRYKNDNKQFVSKQKKKPRHDDQQDLRRAYENVYNKCNDSEVRERTRQIIEQFKPKDRPKQRAKYSRKENVDPIPQSDTFTKQRNPRLDDNIASNRYKLSTFNVSELKCRRRPEYNPPLTAYTHNRLEESLQSHRKPEIQPTRSKYNLYAEPTNNTYFGQNQKRQRANSNNISSRSRSSYCLTRKYNYLQQF